VVSQETQLEMQVVDQELLQLENIAHRPEFAECKKVKNKYLAGRQSDLEEPWAADDWVESYCLEIDSDFVDRLHGTRHRREIGRIQDEFVVCHEKLRPRHDLGRRLTAGAQILL
jgi:hypothetical protein